MRMQIYGHLQRLDLRFYDRNPVGRLMTRVTTDVDVINDLFTSGVVSIFGDVFTLAGIMIVMLSMNWRLALVAFAVLPLIVLVTQWFRRNVRESYRTVRRLIARINAYLQEHITGMSTVQLFRREARAYARVRAINAGAPRSPTSTRSSTTPCSIPAIEVIGALAAALTIWYGGRSVLEGIADARLAGRVPALLAALLPAHLRHVGEVQHPAGRDGLLRADLQAARRTGQHSESAGRAAVRRARRARDARGGHIVFDHVWFAYNPTDTGEPDWVLQRRLVRGGARRARRRSSARRARGSPR